MKAVVKSYGLHIIGVLWGLYGLYLICVDNLLLSPKEIYEVLIPVVLQMLMLLVFRKLFNGKYCNIINSAFVICAGLIILWHFSLNHSISRRIVVGLFLLLPPFATATGYLVSQIKLKVKIPILKHFGVFILSSMINFVIAVFTFYIFHYWI